jgi:predicted transposase YbfD/YdcC
MPNPDIRIAKYFADLPDPRVNRTRKHRLDDILVIALCAVLCGADTFEQIETFGTTREDWLKTFLALPHGIPSHDTFNRVLAALDHNAFSTCFAKWMTELCQTHGLRAIAIDGKACRSAPGDTFSGCLHLVNAWAVENRVFLGSVAVEDNSHEITAIPELLKILDLNGALVTIDAAGCQTEIVTQVRKQGGDYLVAVKGNQPSLHTAIQEAFERAGETEFSTCQMTSSVEDGHGRHEERYVTVLKNPTGLPAEWADVGSVVMVGREREVAGTNTSTVHYYLTSLRTTAKKLAGYIRGHWGVENGLHWCLDVSFREDENRTRDTNAGANLGVVRRVAASLLKQDPGKGSIRTKRLNAALDPNYLKRTLQGFPEI